MHLTMRNYAPYTLGWQSRLVTKCRVVGHSAITWTLAMVELGVQQCFGVVYHELTMLRQVFFGEINPS